MTKNKVHIVGAGPGDPELLTLKAVRRLKDADVVLYDNLVNQEVLGYCRKNCELVYVGKKDGEHAVEQDGINALLLRHALMDKVVVRLKGGDPFVFGRGGEEALYLIKHGVPFEIVPGVSSVLGAPASAGIPLTHRGLSSSCLIVTGHDAGRENASIPWESARSIETLVFLMGVSQRQTIARKLIAAGRPGSDPCAFIERGTTDAQRVILSTLQQVSDAPPAIQSPALFVVGEVVRLHHDLAMTFEGCPSNESFPLHDSDEYLN